MGSTAFIMEDWRASVRKSPGSVACWRPQRWRDHEDVYGRELRFGLRFRTASNVTFFLTRVPTRYRKWAIKALSNSVASLLINTSIMEITKVSRIICKMEIRWLELIVSTTNEKIKHCDKII